MTKRLAILFSLVLLSCLPELPWAYGSDRFVDNGDGTVTDHQLKLMWSKTDNQGDIDWHQAVQWIKYTFSIALPKSYDNWRLPTLEELESLVDKNAERETDCGLKSYIVPQIHLSCGWVWTAESDPIAPTARVFNFDNIYHYKVRKAHRRGYRALAVRNLD
ncbi:MAG: DUF1566 domain-containing protein [Desulfobacteraceae bacterium]|jgi:hypothetical protein